MRTLPQAVAIAKRLIRIRTLALIPLLAVSQISVAQITGAVDVDLQLTVSSTPTETNGRQTIPLKAAKLPIVKGPPGSIVNLNILDYNPIFYTYAVSSVKTETASAKALADIISKLGAFGKTAADTNAAIKTVEDNSHANRGCNTALNKIDITQLSVNLSRTASAITDVLPDALHSLAIASDVSTLRTSAQAAHTNLQVTVQPAKDAVKSLQDLDKLFSQSILGTGKFTLTYCDPGSSAPHPYPAAGAATSLGSLIAGMGAVPGAGAPLAKAELEQVVSFGGTSYAVEIEAFNQFAAVVDQLSQVGVTKTLHTPDKDWPDFASGSDNTATIKVTENKELKTLLTGVSSEIDKHTGDYTIGLQTKELLSFSVSAAVLYSFVKNPTYSVQTANGKLTIMQTANDYNKLAGAIAFNTSLARWDSFFVRPHMQVGVVPDSGKTAILLGLGFSAGLPGAKPAASDSSKQSSTSSQLDLNLGAIYQKATELGAGLAVGQVVSTTQELKTDTAYKVGLYVGIGYSFK